MCDTPYGVTTVARITASGSGEVDNVTFFTPTADGYYAVFGHINGGADGLTVNWTDWESNSKQVDSSSGALPFTAIRVKGGTNITYSVPDSGSASWSFDLLLVKL